MMASLYVETSSYICEQQPLGSSMSCCELE